ncbi:MAG: type IX secretion system protein PorQ [Ichthyobacteriaceae bacterium]|nr:type IX secretion system protein PorQ [Ichthyobacteriaceae bacterium]
MNKLHVKILLLLILPTVAFSQIGGDGTYQFLNLTTSARQAALGGDNITTKDYDVNFAEHNPALINNDMDGNLAFNYINYFSDVNYGSVAYAHSFDSTFTMYTGLKYVDYGSFVRSTSGYNEGEFYAKEMSLNVGFSYSIDSSFTVGSTVKVINSMFDVWNSYGVAVDLGATYNMPNNGMMFALVLKNIGAQLKTYSGLKEKLPFEIQFGVSSKLKHLPLTWTATFDNLQKLDVTFSNPSLAKEDIDGNIELHEVSVLNKVMSHVVIGAELFSEKTISARVGYSFRRSFEMQFKDQRYLSGLSFGLGVNLKKFKLSYGKALYHPAGATNYFSVITDFGKF